MKRAKNDFPLVVHAGFAQISSIKRGGGFSTMSLRASVSTSRKRPARLAALLACALALCSPEGVSAQPAPASAMPNPDAPPCARAQPNPDADADLWGAQAELIGNCVALLPEAAMDRPNVYAVAIAPLGTQTLFSREAKTALQKLAANYGGTAKGGILLSNGAADLMRVPLATQGNVAQVLGEIGRRTQAGRDDILIVYLTSHGGPDAVLQSALPGNLPILAISADSLAAALDQARVRRRVVIISACFAGSWIPALAGDDTIVITAAAADRTSFGCADDRPLTYFGEAFLNGPFSRGASLAESFEGARKTVAQWEEEQKLPFSRPQASVGRNMQAFWLAAPRSPVPVKVAKRR